MLSPWWVEKEVLSPGEWVEWRSIEDEEVADEEVEDVAEEEEED